MSIESIGRDIESGMTLADLLARHQSEMKQAIKKRLTKDQLNRLVVFHQRDYNAFCQCLRVKEMMALAEHF